MTTINCDKISMRLQCNHTIVMADVTKVVYDEHSITITLDADTVFLIKREVVLYPESFITGLAVRVVRCYNHSVHLGTFERSDNSIKFIKSI